MKNKKYARLVHTILKTLIRYDVMNGDVTTDYMKIKGKAKARVISCADGVLAGAEEFEWLYKNYGLYVRKHIRDGKRVKNGDLLFTLYGDVRKLLFLERVGLNIIQRMSGVATKTSRIVEDVGNEVVVLSTRKTLWSYMDKKAVCLGGGLSHRLGLYDAVLIKDNHISYLKRQGLDDPIGAAIERAWRVKKARFIEIEVENEKEAMKAVEKFNEMMKKQKRHIPVIMFDNMKVGEIKRTMKAIKRMGLDKNIIFEASGGINERNVILYAKTGIDAVSIGSITHSANSLDIKEVFEI